MLVSSEDVSSSEKTGINGPCSRSDHCDGGAEGGKNDRNPRVTAVGEGDPQFDCPDQASYDWGPQPNKEKYSGAGRYHLWNHRWGKGFARKLDDREAKEQNGCQNALEENPYTWPAVGECRKQSLQNFAPPVS
jgi:hypothetical protein